jgi:DNA helicase-2/ATP-dependent DNA helicase PcrA
LQLTHEQQSIIQHQHGHAKVIAVAGAGKTSTLSMFIQQRMLGGQNPRRMLVIMYNKSAQQEFNSKLRQQVQAAGIAGPLPQIRTFHSLGLKIYQGLIADGILPAFEGDLLSQGETEGVLWQLMQKAAPNREIAKDILEQKKKWVEPMVSFIDRVKADLDPAPVIFEQMGLPKQCSFFPKVFERFEKWRSQNRRISYNDMLYDPCQLFSKRPDVAQHYANHMDWILVDEYQDINPIQQFLLQTLAGERSQVMVIGDPDQTIYEFRGSKPEFMQSEFDKQFQPVTTYTLSQTFRYGHEVSLLANQLIQHNPHRQPVMCLSHQGNPVTKVFEHVQEDYAQKTVHIIQSSLQQFPAQDIAVLNRLWGISAPIELALLQADIPYHLDHPGWVLERMELQPFMLLLEMSSGVFAQRSVQQRQQAWLTILTLPYLKIKRSLLEQVAYVMGQTESNFSQFFSQQKFEDLTPWQLTQVETRIELAHLAEGNRIKAHQLMNRHIRETDFYKGLSDSAFSKQQVDDRVATVQAFVRFVAKLNMAPVQVYDHVQQLKARKQEQNNRSRQSAENQGVYISSIHKAKGLEWPSVMLQR